MVLRSIERRLERLVEGAFGRAFRSGVRPVELGRKLIREMDGHRSPGVGGRTVVPNHYSFAVSRADLDEFEGVKDSLVRELADAAREHARDERYEFMGPLEIDFEASESLHTGVFRVSSRLKENVGGVGAGSLVLANQERILLGPEIVVVGRMPECAVQLSDPNVSRRHAEIRPAGIGYELVDLGSTNGSKVNGARITTRVLSDGDKLTFGNTTIAFEAS